MKKLRQIHLYLGVFFSPLLFFYVATGWYQTMSVNRNKAFGEKGTWLSSLVSIHVDQIYPKEGVNSYSPTLFKMLVVVMSIALLITLGIGILLAFRSNRKHWPVWLSLVLGVAAPVLLLWLGHGKE